MGKQINYYMGYTDFLKVAQAAIDSGCVIYRHWKENGKWQLSCGNTLDIIKENCCDYFFHLEELGDIEINVINGHQHISYDSLIKVIEAGFSIMHKSSKCIYRNRLYVPTGTYIDSSWVSRSESITKLYSKLVRIVKKIAPYTEIEHFVVNSMYAGEKFKTKEYISSQYLELVQNEDYKLG